jgi:hypothetical protein
MLLAAEATDTPGWSASGISLGFSLGKNPGLPPQMNRMVKSGRGYKPFRAWKSPLWWISGPGPDSAAASCTSHTTSK